MSQPAKAFDESLINFYEENLIAHADTIYRFAFALTLSIEGTSQCVRRAFDQAAVKLEKIKGTDSTSCKMTLINSCWHAFRDLKGKTFTTGQSSVTQAMQSMDVIERAALVAVDVAGLMPTDAAKALEIDEGELRKQLSKARRALLNSSLA